MEPYEDEQTMTPDEKVDLALRHLLMALDAGRPNDRSEKDRLWAILRTDAQKLLAFWFYMEMQ